MNRLKAITGTVEIDVPFHDLDPMEIAWHGNHFKYFEAARKKLLESIHYDIQEMKAAGHSWPVIECKCRYMRPITYGMIIEVTAQLLEIDHRLKISYETRDVATGKRLNRGHTVQVAVEWPQFEMLLTSPSILREKVEAVL